MGMPGMSMSMGGGFGLVASAYFSYSYGKSVRIECLFDEQFRHLDGKPRKNIFDKIKDYAEVLQNNDTAETVFEWNNDNEVIANKLPFIELNDNSSISVTGLNLQL